MSISHLVVTAAGILLILGILRYFFQAQHKVVVAASSQETQIVGVEVRNGYKPAVIEVEAGRPVRLNFIRRDSSSCTEEVVFGDYGIRRFLPTGETVPIEFTPTRAGSYPFTCGMGMVHGKLLVRPAARLEK